MPNSSWVETGTSIDLVPTSTTVTSTSGQQNSPDYLTNADKIALMAQYAQELATKTALDTTASGLGVPTTNYDNAVAGINTTLVNAGAPANWATTWPDGTTFGPSTGIQTALANDWAGIATARTALQSAISATQASQQAAAAEAAAVASAVSTAQTNATNAINAALAILKTAFFLGKWWNAPFPSGGGDLATPPAAVTTNQNINYSTPLSGTPDYPWQNVSLEPSGMTTTTNFYARWTGYVTAGEAGTYTFGVNSDDGANLYVNGVQLISNLASGQGANDTSCVYTQSGTIALSAGQTVPIILEWENTGGPGGIQFIMTPPGGPSQLAIAGTSTIPGSSITAQSITANQIAAGAITAALIAAGTITAGQIAAGTITATQLAAGSVTANAIAANSVTAGAIAAGAINASMITSGTLDASQVNVTNLNASNITTGTIAASKVQFPDGSALTTAGVQTQVATQNNQAHTSGVSLPGTAIPGLSWNVSTASTNDVYNLFVSMCLEQTGGSPGDNCYLTIEVDGVQKQQLLVYCATMNVTQSVFAVASLTGLSAGSHTITLYLGSSVSVDAFTSYPTSMVLCQRIF